MGFPEWEMGLQPTWKTPLFRILKGFAVVVVDPERVDSSSVILFKLIWVRLFYDDHDQTVYGTF